MLVFKFNLPEGQDKDVTTKVLNVKWNDGTEDKSVEVTVGASVMEIAHDDFKVADNTVVTGQLTYFDDANNVKVGDVEEFVVVDNIAPAAPGKLSLVVTAEE